MRNRRIERIVRIAKRYIRRGRTYTDSIRLAQQQVEAGEISKYESKV